MRWPWQRRPAPHTTIPCPRPDLWSPEEWDRQMVSERTRWDAIMEPAIRQYEQAERGLCEAMKLPPPPPLPRPRF